MAVYDIIQLDDDLRNIDVCRKKSNSLGLDYLGFSDFGKFSNFLKRNSGRVCLINPFIDDRLIARDKVFDKKFRRVFYSRDESDCHFLVKMGEDFEFVGSSADLENMVVRYSRENMPSLSLVEPNGSFRPYLVQ